MAPGQACEQLLGDPTRAAPGVDDCLVALQFQALQHGPAPPSLRRRHPVVAPLRPSELRHAGAITVAGDGSGRCGGAGSGQRTQGKPFQELRPLS